MNGGLRVRIWQIDGKPFGYVRGRVPGMPPDRILQSVLDLAGHGAGTVDFQHDGNRNWRIRASGTLAEDGFEQRLRNVIVNA